MLKPEPRSEQPDRQAPVAPELSLNPSERVPSPKDGLRFARRFTNPGVHPYDEIEWERRDAVISGSGGEIAFEQRNVEVPKSWSQLATNVVAQKYFRGPLGSPDREYSVRQLLDRVVRTAGSWGLEGGYFATEEDPRELIGELALRAALRGTRVQRLDVATGTARWMRPAKPS